jgi:hypothetical protein
MAEHGEERVSMDFSAAAHRLFRLGVFLSLSVLLAPAGWSDSRDQAKRIHDRIAGVPPDEATLSEMATAIDDGDAVGAAFIATEAPEFYNVTLKNLAAPWTNEFQNVFVPLNDYIATIIGMVRDGLLNDEQCALRGA